MDDQIKNLLVELRKLPKYQLERRIDIFILKYLEDALRKLKDNSLTFLYPEFPLHNIEVKDADLNINNLNSEFIQTINEVTTNHNSNADYLFISNKSVYLVELKTDSHSFDSYKQILYYAYYNSKPFKNLYDFYKDNLAFGKNQDPKWKVGFDYLNNQLKKYFNTDDFESELSLEVKILYILPKKSLETKAGLKINEVGYPFDFEFITLEELSSGIPNKNLKEILLDIEKE